MRKTRAPHKLNLVMSAIARCDRTIPAFRVRSFARAANEYRRPYEATFFSILSTAEQIGRMRRSKIPSRDWRGPGERTLFSLGVRGRSSEQLGAGVYLSGADSSRHSSPKCARGA